MLYRIAVVVSLALSGSPVYAASISWNLAGSVTVQGADDRDDTDGTFEDLTDNSTKRLSVGVGTTGPGSGGGTAFYSIDRKTGEIGFGASAAVQGAAFGRVGDGQAGTNVNFTIFEDYTIAGTGDLTFDMRLTGLLEGLAESDRGANVNVSASLSLFQPPSFGSLALDVFRDNISQNDTETTRGINEMLSITVSDPDPGTYQLRVSLSAGAGAFSQARQLIASGDADFGSTAFLSLTTSGDLTATPSDPEFLSAVGGPLTPIPLPPGFFLLGMGLAGLGLMRRRPRQ